MSSGLLDFDTSHRRQNSCRDSDIEEVDYDTAPSADAPAVMKQQQSQSSRPQLLNDFHEPPSKYPESDSHKHQLSSSNSNSSDADPSDLNDTANGGRRVRRPNWARSPSLTLQNNNNTAAKNRRPNLLRSVSMRSSFTIGRRSTAPTEHNNFFNRGGEDEHPMSATLEGGRNTDNKDRRNTDTTNKKKKKKGYIIRRWSHSDDDRPKNIVKRDIADASELSHYQEVFQQMKLQNPTLSLGALQQKTMKRMSELKVEKEEMERMNLQRLMELESSAGRHGHHGSNSNGGNGRMTLLGSLFHHRPRAGSDLSDRNSSGLGSDHSDHDNHNNSNTSNNHNHQGVTLPKAPYNVDDSFRSNNSVDSSHRGVLSRATILISQSLSSNNNNQESTTAAGEGSYPSLRRSTIDTNPSTEADGSNDGSGAGVGGVPLILRTSLILMGEDQNGNLAPRKSVGDFTAMMAGWDDQDSDDDDYDDDDAMFEIDRSKSSGLFISGDEESKASGLYRSEGDENAAFLDEVERDLSNRGEDDNYVKLEILETHLQQLDASHRSRPHCGEMSSNTFHSLMSMSEISNHTTVTEGSYTDCSGSLIVGFGKQRVEKEDESRGFAADFSAWENI